MSTVYLQRRGHRRPGDAYDAPPSVRVPHWKQALRECIESARAREFKYGQFDCALFAAECLQAMTGTDYAASIRGYKTRAQALSLIQQAGGLQQLVTQQLGLQPVHKSRAMHGDVVLADVPTTDAAMTKAVGICIGAQCVFAGPGGIAFHPRSVIDRAWRVA